MRLAAIVVLLYSTAASAVTLDDVLVSSRQHYPKIAAALQEVEAQKGNVQKAQGAFDWTLNSDVSGRAGIYDGLYADTEVTRRLSDSNTRIFGGYKLSDGQLPIYEDQFNTGQGGEFNVGILFSLLRNRIIDEERFYFADSTLALKQKESDLLLAKLRTQHEAMVAYLEWVALGKSVAVVKELVALAQERQQGFDARVQHGDIARIYLTENQQYILKRKTELNDLQRQFDNAAVKLSLFLRDEAGTPKIPKTSDLSALGFPHPPSLELKRLGEEIERARALRPEMIVLDIGAERERNQLMLGENAVLPKLDMKLEAAQDVGSRAGISTGQDARIGLTLSIPLERNTGEGMIRRSRAKLKQLEHDKQLLNDQIAAEIQSIANNFHAAREFMQLTLQEVQAAAKMQDAEQKRFRDGAADFFVLNMREEKTAEARIRNVQSTLTFWKAIAHYYFATLQSDKLLLEEK